MSESAIKQFNRENSVSRTEAEERDYRIFAVHGRLTDQGLLSSVFEDFYVPTNEDDDEELDEQEIQWRKKLSQVKQLREESVAPTDIMQKLINESEQSERYTRLGAVKRPVQADIWLRPEYEREEEDPDEDDQEEFEID